MTVTTIKVSRELRDLLKAQAAARHRTLGEHLEALARDEARHERFAAVREAMHRVPPDEEYLRDSLEWQSDAWS